MVSENIKLNLESLILREEEYSLSCFDTFVGEINCIKCGKKYKFEEQTKEFDCCMRELLLGDYICDSNRSFFYPFSYTCPNCGQTQEWVIAIKNGQIVSFFDKERTKEKDLLKKLHNIEKNYARNVIYRKREICLLGEDTRSSTICFDEDGYGSTFDIGINKMITVFGEKWVIEAIYKVELNDEEDEPTLTGPARNFMQDLQKKTLVCKVHNCNLVERFLILTDLYFPMLKRPSIYDYDSSTVNKYEEDDYYVIPNHCHLTMVTTL